METLEIKIYSYNELSQEAKDNAFDNYLQSFDYPYTWEVLETIEKGLEHFMFKMNGYNIDIANNQASINIKVLGDDYSWGSPYGEGIDDTLLGARLYSYLSNQFCIESFIQDFDCDFTGYYLDYCFIEPIIEFMKEPTNITLGKLMVRCVSSVIKAAHEDYNHMTSEEYFKGECWENDYKFLLSGKSINELNLD